MAYRQFGTNSRSSGGNSSSSSSPEEEHGQRRRLPPPEQVVTHRSVEPQQWEQAQHVLAAAAGILDASSSSWEGIGGGPASSSLRSTVNSSSTSTTTSAIGGPLFSQQQPATPTTIPRSNPIAIRRKHRDEFSSSSSSSSSDDDDETTTDDPSRFRLAGSYDPTTTQHRAAQSLPQQYHYLLRAPHLGSLPTRNAEECVPTISLSEPEEALDDAEVSGRRGREGGSQMSYGSLRESQLQGRFLEGPRSLLHREKQSGQLRQRTSNDSSNQRNVRSGSMASSAPVQQGLSIGERIQQSRQQQKARAQNNSSNHPLDPPPHPTASTTTTTTTSSSSADNPKPKTSSLAAMLEDITAAVNPKSTRTGNPWEYDTAVVNAHDFHDDSTDMLSTSLTGLEILQRGLQQQQSLPYSTIKNTGAVPRSRSSSISTQQQQPRQSSSISSLSRSLSDRQYESRRAPLHQSVFYPSGGGGSTTPFRMAPDAAAFGSQDNNTTTVVPPYSTTTTARYQTHGPQPQPQPPAAASTAKDSSSSSSSSFAAAASFRTPPFPAAAAAPSMAPYRHSSVDADEDLPDHNSDVEGAFDMDFE